MAAILNNLHIVKNAHGVTSGTRRIWNQHLHIDQKPSKNSVYVEKQGYSINSMGPILGLHGPVSGCRDAHASRRAFSNA